MDILTNRSKRDYRYTSRYSTFPYYYNTVDKKYMYGLTNNLLDTTTYTMHEIQQDDTLDSLALKYYGRPDLFWVIGDYNRIIDPYTKLSDEFNYIYIPELSGIRYS